MKTTDLLVDSFLILGVACQLVCCLGVLVFGNVFDRLHFAGAGTTLGPLLVGGAVLVRQTTSAAGAHDRDRSCGATKRARSHHCDRRGGGSRMIPLQVVILALVAVGGLAVVLQRDPLRQTVVNGLYGLLLVVLFMVFQAPDVALSMLVVGAIAYPLVLLTTIARVRGRTEDTTEDGDER